MALIRLPVGPAIEAHDGPVVFVFAVFASFVRHKLAPPARIRFELFGSSTNGAMNSACWLIASGIRNGRSFHAHSNPFQYWPLMYSEIPRPFVLRLRL